MVGSGGRFRRTCLRPDPVELSLRPPFVLETKDPIPVAAADDHQGMSAARDVPLRGHGAWLAPAYRHPKNPKGCATGVLEVRWGKGGSGRCSTRLSYTRLAPHGRIRTSDHLGDSDETASCTTIGSRRRSGGSGRITAVVALCNNKSDGGECSEADMLKALSTELQRTLVRWRESNPRPLSPEVTASCATAVAGPIGDLVAKCNKTSRADVTRRRRPRSPLWPRRPGPRSGARPAIAGAWPGSAAPGAGRPGPCARRSPGPGAR